MAPSTSLSNFLPTFWSRYFSTLFLSASLAAGQDILIADFEGPDHGGWEVSGEAFASGPVHKELFAQLEIQNQVGNGLLCSAARDAATPNGRHALEGRIVSPEFTIERRYIAFRIGGGDFEQHCCMNLIVEGKVVKRATGRDTDGLQAQSWDVAAFAGKTAKIEIVDAAIGPRWGYILVDHLIQTDHPEVGPVVMTPLYQEALRPQFHFTARLWTMDRVNPGPRQEGWINDLNGMIYDEGEYHLFAQRWNKCWLHAVSTDLVHWEELEPAFWEPTLGSGVQSGHCVIDYKNTSGLGKDASHPAMVAFYSYNNNHSQGIAYSLDKGRSWQHYKGNPVVEFPHRDPKVFWHEPTGKWVMVIYGSGNFNFLTSSNLLQWEDVQSAVPDAFECPDFFEAEVVGAEPGTKKWVLIHGDGKYSIGTFDGIRFHEETPRFMCDFGEDVFYATQTFENVHTGDGRRIQMAWIRDIDHPGRNRGPQPRVFPDMPFAEQLTFPCVLTLRQTAEGPRLFRKPIPEIAKLELVPKTWERRDFKALQTETYATSGDAYRLQVRVGNLDAGTVIKFNIRGSEVAFKQRSVKIKDASGTLPDPFTDLSQPLEEIEILIDRRSLEVFVNDGQATCSRILIPTHNDISVKIEGGSATLHSVRLTPLKSMWEGFPSKVDSESPNK